MCIYFLGSLLYILYITKCRIYVCMYVCMYVCICMNVCMQSFLCPRWSKIRGHLVFEVSVCVSVYLCVYLSVGPDHKVTVFLNCPKSNSFYCRPSILGTIPSPYHPHYMWTSSPSKFKVKVICGPWLKFFCSQVKVFQTALNQSVFIADLPYLAHTFNMSPPLHVHVPTFQVQGQCHLRTLVKVFL
jgi:hypothetical protein